ncbi:20232_t:CDS:2 [Cetraspora pellucida]|uniref:20232_t:CDS:1 n=1 Tax=Cetraspora pellucida TaxID=1433469 RepID=A0A9N9J9R3_9GLOM|nr:20232_t:CDS:2 [Cetraspora pellucida]
MTIHIVSSEKHDPGGTWKDVTDVAQQQYQERNVQVQLDSSDSSFLIVPLAIGSISVSFLGHLGSTVHQNYPLQPFPNIIQVL